MNVIDFKGADFGALEALLNIEQSITFHSPGAP
jgi:hypothetical protein